MIALCPQADPVGRCVACIVEHIKNHLLQRGIGHHRAVVKNAVVVHQRFDGARGAPVLHHGVQELAHRGLAGSLTARFASRQQDTAHDGFAALHLRLHLGDVFLKYGVWRLGGHAFPVAEDDGHGGQRSAQFVGRAGCQ
ncbi:hypothetical protein D3C71_1513380 [compost metagenome]